MHTRSEASVENFACAGSCMDQSYSHERDLPAHLRLLQLNWAIIKHFLDTSHMS